MQCSCARWEERGLEGAEGRGEAGSPKNGRLGLWRSPVPRATRSRPGGRAAMQEHREAASDACLKRGGGEDKKEQGKEERKERKRNQAGRWGEGEKREFDRAEEARRAGNTGGRRNGRKRRKGTVAVQGPGRAGEGRTAQEVEEKTGAKGRARSVKAQQRVQVVNARSLARVAGCDAEAHPPSTPRPPLPPNTQFLFAADSAALFSRKFSSAPNNVLCFNAVPPGTVPSSWRSVF